MKKAAKWVYSTGGKNANDKERVEVVIDIKDRKEGANLVALAYKSQDKVVLYAIQSVSDNGICIVAMNEAALDEPFWLLKLPHINGRKWDAVLAFSCVGRW